MKRIVILSVVFLMILVLTYMCAGFIKIHNQYTAYVDFRLNDGLDSICTNIIKTDTVLKNVLEKKYVLESELYNLESSHRFYVRALYDVIDIAKYLKDYEFQVTMAPEARKFTWIHGDLYYPVDNIFRNEYKHFELKASSKRYLSNHEVEILEQYHDFISQMTDIVRKNFQYYSEYIIYFKEEEENGEFITMGYVKTGNSPNSNTIHGLKLKSSEDIWIKFINQVRQLYIND